VGLMLSSSAAFLKLCHRAEASKNRIAFNEGKLIRGDLFSSRVLIFEFVEHACWI